MKPQDWLVVALISIAVSSVMFKIVLVIVDATILAETSELCAMLDGTMNNDLCMLDP